MHTNMGACDFLWKNTLCRGLYEMGKDDGSQWLVVPFRPQSVIGCRIGLAPIMHHTHSSVPLGPLKYVPYISPSIPPPSVTPVTNLSFFLRLFLHLNALAVSADPPLLYASISSPSFQLLAFIPRSFAFLQFALPHFLTMLFLLHPLLYAPFRSSNTHIPHFLSAPASPPGPAQLIFPVHADKVKGWICGDIYQRCVLPAVQTTAGIKGGGGGGNAIQIEIGNLVLIVW